MAALRQAGLVETTRGRGGGTVVTLRLRTPSARTGGAHRRRHPRDLARHAGLPVRRRARARPSSPPPPSSTAAHRAQLEQAHAAVASAGKPAQHRQADSRFHLTVAALSGSPRVIEAVTAVQATLHEMLLAIPVLDTNIAHSDRQHAAVVKAILAGQPDRARRAMEEHCDDTAALLRGLVG